MTRLCSVCARGGSKGVTNKNLRDLLGKPLIAHSILQARATGLFDAIAVSSDSEAILEAAGQWGADYLIQRPDELARDESPKLPVIRHCAAEAERKSERQFDTFVDLDATSPLRMPEDIVGAVKLLEEEGRGNVITAMPSRRSPYFNMVELTEKGVPRLAKQLPVAVARRQDAPACYDMNASIYVWTRQALFEAQTLFQDDTGLFVMPEERSIDIDTELDFAVVECIARKRGGL